MVWLDLPVLATLYKHAMTFIVNRMTVWCLKGSAILDYQVSRRYDSVYFNSIKNNCIIKIFNCIIKIFNNIIEV